MSCITVVSCQILFLISLVISAINGDCYKNYTDLQGTIVIDTYFEPSLINCTISIVAPNNTIITARIDEFIAFNSPVSLHLGTSNNYSREISSSQLKPIYLRKKTSPLQIILVNSPQTIVMMKLVYYVRSNTRCPEKHFECVDKSGCFNFKDVCNNIFDCPDHSDEITCSNCSSGFARCDGTSDHCFNPVTQRCDKKKDCPGGEDEANCTKSCKGDDYCGLRRKAKPTYVISLNTFAAALCLGVILCFLFMAILYRWCTTRRNITMLIENPPEIPLPPFRGPGEEYNGYEIQFSETDFMHGGEIYEAFVRTRRRIGQRRRRLRQSPLPNSRIVRSVPLLDMNAADFDSLALASLGIRPENCAALSKEIQEKLEAIPLSNLFKSEDDEAAKGLRTHSRGSGDMPDRLDELSTAVQSSNRSNNSSV